MAKYKARIPGTNDIIIIDSDSNTDLYRPYSKGGGAGHGNKWADIMYYITTTGVIPTTREEAEEAIGKSISKQGWNNFKKEIPIFLDAHNISNADLIKIREASGNYVDAQSAAQNAYYRDIYSMEEGSTGRSIYDNMVQAEQNAALSNTSLADAQMQSAAMQQAQTVKSITDQIRAERMAKLRAGMSEAQIANEDMNMLMNNINALNQQAYDMNNVRLQAQQQYGLAQDTAYQQWLNNANTIGQTGAAMAAADAGDVYQQALRIQRQTGKTFNQALKEAQGKDE